MIPFSHRISENHQYAQYPKNMIRLKKLSAEPNYCQYLS